MHQLNDVAALTGAEVHMQWGIKIPLRDGVRLSATLYLPKDKIEPAPALFALTPYTVHRNHSRACYFAKQGYPFLVVDARGRGNAEGNFRPNIQEAQDGHDIVEWIARQPFCSGKVAMFSGSYEGYAQWAAAKEFPPHLITIVPSVAAAPGIDFPMRNNIPFPYAMRWLTCTAGRTQQERIFEDQEFWRDQFREWYGSGRPFKHLDSLVGNPSPIFQEWISHPALDAYWDAYRPTPQQYARLDLPILTLTGTYDANQPGALHFYREHHRHASQEALAKHFLVIGPWDHQGALAPKPEFGGLKFGEAALLDVLRLHLDWYEWTLRGGPKPAFLQKNVAYYVMGTETWRYAESLDAITARITPFYLHSAGASSSVFESGSLREKVGNGPPDCYRYDPRDLTSAEMESELGFPLPFVLLRPTFPADSLVDQTMVYANEGKTLIYHSAPFLQDVELSGFFKLTAWIAIDQPDTDFMVTIYEITIDGRSILLTSDLMRARYRESLREQKLIETTEPLRYDFERFTFVSKQVQKGSRLRLVIGPVDSIYYQKNYNSGRVVADESMEDACPVIVKLYHDEAHPSALYVPFGQPDTVNS